MRSWTSLTIGEVAVAVATAGSSAVSGAMIAFKTHAMGFERTDQAVQRSRAELGASFVQRAVRTISRIGGAVDSACISAVGFAEHALVE